MASFASMNARDIDPATTAEIERTHNRLEAAEATSRKGDVVFHNVGKDASGTMQFDAGYPAHLKRFTPEEDERLQTIKEFTGPTSIFKQPTLDERTIEYFRNKKKDAEFYEREKWLASKWDLSDPITAQWFNQLLPSFTQRRYKYGMDKLQVQKQLFEIALFGPRSEEDLDFMWAVETGKLDIEEIRRPIWEKPKDITDVSKADAIYKAGLFAPSKSIITDDGKYLAGHTHHDKGFGMFLEERAKGGRVSNAGKGTVGINNDDIFGKSIPYTTKAIGRQIFDNKA